jgi:hypothetical protein
VAGLGLDEDAVEAEAPAPEPAAKSVERAARDSSGAGKRRQGPAGTGSSAGKEETDGDGRR